MDRMAGRNSSPVWTISPASLLSCSGEGLNGLDNPAFYQEEATVECRRKEVGGSYLVEDSESEAGGKSSRRRKRCGGRVILLVAAICVLMAVLLAMVAAVVYLAVGEVRTTWQNEAEYKEMEEGLVYVVEGRLRITNRVFTADLLDPRSDSFTHLAQQITHAMDAVFLHSLQHYNETKVLGYRPGSVVAVVRVHLGRGRGDAPHHVGMAVVGALERHHGYLPGGRLQVDIRSLHFASLPDPDDNVPIVRAEEVPAPLPSTTAVPASDTNQNTTTDDPPEDEEPADAECGDCGAAGRVCLFLPPSPSPRCLEPRDPTDPTGCGGWCLSEHQLCRKVGNGTYQCADSAGSACEGGGWRCGNGLCVAEGARCNGRIECYDMTDEMDCECGSGQFKCGGGTPCLPESAQCDGHVDCWDASDELNCTRGATCGEGLFTCNSGLCVHSKLFCDRFPDCPDGSDEPSGCGDACNGSRTTCGNGRCVDRRLWCNGQDDCGDSTDEKDCEKTAT